MLPNTLLEKILFNSKFKKKPIDINKKKCYNCKNNYSHQESNFNNNLLFFGVCIEKIEYTICDYASSEWCQDVISELIPILPVIKEPEISICDLSGPEWCQSIIESLSANIPIEIETELTYCNTGSDFWCSDVIKYITPTFEFTYCNTSSGLWCSNVIKGL